MTQFFLHMEDIPFLDIMHVEMNCDTEEVSVIVGYGERGGNLPLFNAELLFINKMDGKWAVDCRFFCPDYVYMQPIVKRKMKSYLTEIFGPLIEAQIANESTNLEPYDAFNAFGEEIERELAHMSM